MIRIRIYTKRKSGKWTETWLELEFTKKESLTNEVETLLDAKNRSDVPTNKKKVGQVTRKNEVLLESEVTVSKFILQSVNSKNSNQNWGSKYKQIALICKV